MHATAPADAPQQTSNTVEHQAPQPLLGDHRRPTSSRWLLHRIAMWSLVVTVAVSALIAGIQYRKATWLITDPLRFGDIFNGYGWGYSAASEGYLNQYEKMQDQEPHWGRWLDYAPLRLGVMTLWGQWTIEKYGDTGGAFQRPYEFTAPVLWFNTFMELVASVAAFLLVRTWIVQSATAPPRRGLIQWVRQRVLNEPVPALMVAPPVKPLLGIKRATIAALCLWFNPAMVLSAHAWPTWDMWIIPVYLLAVWLCVKNWWFAAGVVVGVGAMFKGQQLTVAAVFVIWPLLQGRPMAAVRWVVGVLFAIALVASPWLLSYLEPEALAKYRAVQANYPWGQYPLVSNAETARKIGVAAVPRIIDGPAVAWVVCVGIVTALVPLVMRWRWIDDLGSDAGPLPSTEVPDYRRSDNLANEATPVPVSEGLRAARRDSLDRLRERYFGNARLAFVVLMAVTLLTWPVYHGRFVPMFGLAWWPLAVVTGIAALTVVGLLSGRTVRLIRDRWIRAIVAVVLITVAVAWPVFVETNTTPKYVLPLAGLTAGAIALLVPIRLAPMFAGGVVAGALLLCTVIFHGSANWWNVGVMFGTRHWPWMVMGQTSNLPGILAIRYGQAFGWARYTNDVNQNLYAIAPDHWLAPFIDDGSITAKEFFNSIYVVLLVVCAVGVAIQHRRRDPRFLAAITAPWVMMFTFPTQIHERYLLYAAGVGMVMIGTSPGLLLLALFMTAVTWIMTFNVMVSNGNRWGFGQNLHHLWPSIFSDRSGESLHRFVVNTHPDIGWAVLLCAGIMLYVTLAPTKRQERIVLLDGSRAVA